jgi:hypothetical protein
MSADSGKSMIEEIAEEAVYDVRQIANLSLMVATFPGSIARGFEVKWEKRRGAVRAACSPDLPNLGACNDSTQREGR